MKKEAKDELFKILDSIGKKLDISNAQYRMAKKRYEAVGDWLAKGKYCLTNGNKVCLVNGEIYPQGSIGLATAVKPIGQGEFDVDLVFFTPNVTLSDIDPSELNRLIGDRLRENSDYKRMMESSPNNGRLKRGWRITYADEFHLDITPSINNPTESNNSEYVPDRKLQDWKPSNPKDYADWFNSSASKLPSFNYIAEDSIRAGYESHKVTDFPKDEEIKPLLKRYVQILKRHRDEMFKGKEQKPISIIITTLVTHTYNKCIKTKQYDNKFDLLVDIIRELPLYIEKKDGEFFILNPTTQYENFAERWNEVPAKKIAFYKWQETALISFENLSNIVGRDKIFVALEKTFGQDIVSIVNDDINQKVDTNRKKGLLGLGTTSSSAESIKQNTFYGK